MSASVPVLTRHFCVAALIENLFDVIDSNLSSSKYNVIVAFLILGTAREAYIKLNDYIEKTELEGSVAWDNYDFYTSAIDPFEKFLLHFASITEGQSQDGFSNVGSIHERISAFNEWTRRRDQFRSLFECLNPSPVHVISQPAPKVDLTVLQKLGLSIVQDKFNNARQCDDLAGLNALFQQICKPLGDRDARIGNAQNAVNAISSKLSKSIKEARAPIDGMMVEIFRMTILLHWVMQQLRLKPMVRGHLTSPIVWTAAERALSALNLQLEPSASSEGDVKDVREKISFFEDLLKGIPDTPSSALLQLQKMAKRVRRPFHSQTLILIAQCRELVRLSMQTTEQFEYVITAIEEANYAIHVAAHAITSTGIFNEDIQKHRASSAFRDAEGKIMKTFTRLKLTTEWQKLKRVAIGMEEDIQRVKQMNAHLEKMANSPRDPPSSNTILVRIVVLSNPKLNCERTVEERARLSMLLWERASLDASLLRGSWMAIVEDTKSHKLVPVFDDMRVADVPVVIGQGGARVVYIIS